MPCVIGAGVNGVAVVSRYPNALSCCWRPPGLGGGCCVASVRARVFRMGSSARRPALEDTGKHMLHCARCRNVLLGPVLQQRRAAALGGG